MPPFAATYSANLSFFVSAATGAGSATAARSFVSQFLAPFCGAWTSPLCCGARGASGPVNACAVASKAKAMLERPIFTRCCCAAHLHASRSSAACTLCCRNLSSLLRDTLQSCAEPSYVRTATRILLVPGRSRPLVRPADTSLVSCIRTTRRMEASSPPKGGPWPFCDCQARACRRNEHSPPRGVPPTSPEACLTQTPSCRRDLAQAAIISVQPKNGIDNRP